MPEIGEMLRAGREVSGLSREEMARTLRVPVSTVEALEAERWEDLPAPVYIRGFVSSWCRVAGIDAAPARDALLRSLGSAAGSDLSLPGVMRETGITVGVRPATRRAGRRLTLGVTILLLLAVCAFAAMHLTGRHGRDSGLSVVQPASDMPVGQGFSKPDAGFSSAAADVFGE